MSTFPPFALPLLSAHRLRRAVSIRQCRSCSVGHRHQWARPSRDRRQGVASLDSLHHLTACAYPGSAAGHLDAGRRGCLWHFAHTTGAPSARLAAACPGIGPFPAHCCVWPRTAEVPEVSHRRPLLGCTFLRGSPSPIPRYIFECCAECSCPSPSHSDSAHRALFPESVPQCTAHFQTSAGPGW